jgi:hypothetical protein
MSAIVITRGNDAVFSGVARREGIAVDLTGAVLWFTAKRSARDPDSSAVLAKDTVGGGVAVVDAVAGSFRVVLSEADTGGVPVGRYAYSIKLLEADGTTTTIERGVLAAVSAP